jgi:hypothetical protein
MRYMLIMEAPESMAMGGDDAPRPEDTFEAMGRYNTDLVDAGVLLAAEGLAPSSEGFVVTHDDEGASVTDGPFAEAKEVVGGFALLEAASKQEAIELAKTFLDVAGDGECEIRQIFAAPEEAPFDAHEAQARMKEQYVKS